MKTHAERAAYVAEYLDRRSQTPSAAQVTDVIKALDARGAWVTDDVRVHPIIESGMNPGTTAPIRGISTGVFVRNLRVLSAYLAGQATARKE
jgi:hypothetical protein